MNNPKKRINFRILNNFLCFLADEKPEKYQDEECHRIYDTDWNFFMIPLFATS